MATQQQSGHAKIDRKFGELYLVEHSFYDSHNNLTLKHNDVVQTDCTNWVKRMGSCLGELRQLPPKRKADEVIRIVGCEEDGGGADVVEESDDEVEEAPAPARGGRKFSRRGAEA